MKKLFGMVHEGAIVSPLVTVLGITIHPLSLDNLMLRLKSTLHKRQRLLVGNVNIHAMNLIHESMSVRQAFQCFDIVFCDGFGVMLGGRLSGQYIPERYTPPDFIHPLMQIVQSIQGKVFLLGAAPGVVERAAQTLIEQTPELQIAGVQHGYFDKSLGSHENDSVIAKINAVSPSVLLVGFGMPKQEEWLARNWRYLNVKIALTVGALFDTLANDIPRAPRWITDRGFEWLTRLVIEPRRLWRRYLIGNPLFFWRVIIYDCLKMKRKNI